MMLRHLSQAFKQVSGSLANRCIVANTYRSTSLQNFVQFKTIRRYKSDSPASSQAVGVDLNGTNSFPNATEGDMTSISENVDNPTTNSQPTSTPIDGYNSSNQGVSNRTQRPDKATKLSVKEELASLERIMNRFEAKCQRNEYVMEPDFVKTFESIVQSFSKIKEIQDAKVSISIHLATLLRCCGKLMISTEAKQRELHAGNVWHFIKGNNLPVDISHYNSLVRSLNENHSEFDPQKILAEISEANLNPDRVTYQRLIHQYCLRGDITGATNLLEKMKELQMNLNEQIFASLIIGYSKQDAPPSVKEIFSLMKTNSIEPSSLSYSTAILTLANSLPTRQEVENELNDLLDDMIKEEIHFNLDDLIDCISVLSPLKQNETVKKILSHLMEVASGFGGERRLLRSLIMEGFYQEASKLYWSRRPTERAIANGNAGHQYIRLLVSKEVPADFCMSECHRLKQESHNRRPYDHLFYCAADEGRLDLVRECIKVIGETEEISHVHYLPLVAQAKDDEEIIQVLRDDVSRKLSSSSLMEIFSEWVWPRFSDNFEKLFKINEELKYNKGILISSFLNYAVREGKMDEAIQFISKAPKDLLVAEDDGSVTPDHEPKDRYKRSYAGVFLNRIARETKNPELVERAYALCQVPGEQVQRNVASSLIRVHLLNDDFDSALKTFLKLARQHGITPLKTELIIHCLEKKDPESLQKIVDISSELYGQSNALFDLACCCIKVNKLKQAKKIISTGNLRLFSDRVYRTCNSIATNNSIEVLENFVTLAKEIHGVDHEILYQILIETYKERALGERALNLWNMMQEEDFQPSKQSLLQLAEVLEQNGIEVPFQKPRGDLTGADKARPGSRAMSRPSR